MVSRFFWKACDSEQFKIWEIISGFGNHESAGLWSGCVTRNTGGQDGDIIQDKHMGQAEGNILI